MRADPHAQHEIRVYADILLDTLKLWAPLTHDAFCRYNLTGYHLSMPAMALVRKLISGEEVDMKDTGLSKRELTELLEIL